MTPTTQTKVAAEAGRAEREEKPPAERGTPAAEARVWHVAAPAGRPAEAPGHRPAGRAAAAGPIPVDRAAPARVPTAAESAEMPGLRGAQPPRPKSANSSSY